MLKQVLHIFRKDVRRLWPLIAVTEALFAIAVVPFGFGFVARGMFFPAYGAMLLLVLSCWFLGARVVHEDAIPGPQQFWLTRPYNRAGLLLAKVLFLSVFELIPLLILGAASESCYGIPILPNAARLLAWGIVTSSWLILPPIALGSVTRKATGFLGALLAIGLAAAVYAFYGVFHAHWFGPAVAAPGITNLAGTLPLILFAMGAVVLQYNWRRTGWSRVLLMAGLLAPALTLPADGLVSLSTRLENPGFDPARVHIAFDESVPPRFEGTIPLRQMRCESLALKIDGLPAGASLESFGDSSLEIDSSRGGGKYAIPQYSGMVWKVDNGFREVFCMEDARYEIFKGVPVTLRLTLDATVRSTTDEVRVPLHTGAVGNAGRCEVIGWEVQDGIDCQLAIPAFDSLNAVLEYSGHAVYSTTFLSNRYSFPLFSVPVRYGGFSFSLPGMTRPGPKQYLWRDPGAMLVLRTERAIGYVQRDLVYHGLLVKSGGGLQ